MSDQSINDLITLFVLSTSVIITTLEVAIKRLPLGTRS